VTHLRTLAIPLMVLAALALTSCSSGPPAPAGNAPASTNFAAQPPNPNAVPNAIPYAVQFQPVTTPANQLPALQAHCMAPAQAGGWYAVGGRITGLHHFDNNGFPTTGQNTKLWWINPATMTGTVVVDLAQLPPALGNPLMATNQQCYFDGSNWLIAGGYGSDPTTKQLTTFDTLMRLPIESIAAAARDASKTVPQKNAAVASLIEIIHNPIFRTTGGVLQKTQNFYVLSFGQSFDGNYNPFGTGYTQRYNEVISYFTLKPGKLALNTSGSIPSSDPTHPFHRRDFPATRTVDPNTGNPQLVVFAGVFPAGLLAGFTNAVFISENLGQLMAKVDNKLVKRFAAYQCPTIPIYDKAGKTVFYTFFGGVSHFWYFQTASQHQVYEDATAQGRSDGLPFSEDISTVIEKSDGTYAEFIAPQPIPGNMLHGSSIDFLPSAGAKILPGGIVDLDAFANGESAVIGYIYGGIEALNPFPTVPNTGTQATNAFYTVTLTRTPSTGIPASQGHEARGISDHTGDARTKQ
jgi:hypothetical protein